MNMIRKATDTQLTFLRNSGASFKVILADGETIVYDPNNLLEPTKSVGKWKRGESRNPGVKRGEPTGYVMPFIKDLEPGQVVTIPNKYHYGTMRSVVCNLARNLWGDGGYMTEQNTDRTATTLLRIK